MRKIELVSVRPKDSYQPRRGRGAAVSTERRYRYPAEEVWEVSEESWQPAEVQYRPGDRRPPVPGTNSRPA